MPRYRGDEPTDPSTGEMHVLPQYGKEVVSNAAWKPWNRRPLIRGSSIMVSHNDDSRAGGAPKFIIPLIFVDHNPDDVYRPFGIVLPGGF